jgi:hypothetical protein
MPMLVLLLMLAEDPAVLIAHARAQLALERRCPDRTTTDVTVCGRRNADRFRVPLKIVAEPGPGVANNAAYEREALLHRTNPIQDLSPFLVGGGMAGASVSTKTGSGSDSGKTSFSGTRPLAP